MIGVSLEIHLIFGGDEGDKVEKTYFLKKRRFLK